MGTLILLVASFGQLPPALPALPQPVAFDLKTSCPASCTCKDCKCRECKGDCSKARCWACENGLFCPRCSCVTDKTECVCVRGKSSDKVGVSHVAQNCPGGVCQLPAVKVKPVYAPRPQVYYLPRYSSGGCASGNCANGNCSPQRRGLFGRR